eukprot:CAMPEP_0170388100 /NCGR_PEP_ID=MMETSP0117_2-20130122/17907_1 /TAXON_ID=400756 /ORGANISM="Durinskia baltica, Strain CSIRO CS-38" /LENGTH=132 /DNA_ID=CAMNT_0010644005 /DNA_START=14 /DNA_END=412 /DNA_ORIENTATION=-
MEMQNGHPIIDIFLPTFRMEPEEEERFFPSKAKAIGDQVISDILNGTVYDEEEAKNWSIDISDKIRESVRESMGPNSRFKLIVQTTIGQMKDQGIRIASRCLWDSTTDNYASCSYKNETLFCCALIFALYTD